MATAARNRFADFPPGWEFFDNFAPHVGVEHFGFAVSLADVNRFAARYRAARCFRSVDFEGLSANTIDGYTSLIQALLTYSAIEHFIRCLGLNLRAARSLFADGEQGQLLTRLRRLNGQSELFSAIRPHLDQRHQHHVDAHLRGEDCNPLYLAASVRHAFAHGKLAANPTGVPSATVGTVSRFLSRALMTIMDREFVCRVDTVAEEFGYTNG